jgi:hypothetical protein
MIDADPSTLKTEGLRYPLALDPGRASTKGSIAGGGEFPTGDTQVGPLNPRPRVASRITEKRAGLGALMLFLGVLLISVGACNGHTACVEAPVLVFVVGLGLLVLGTSLLSWALASFWGHERPPQ